MRNAEIKAVGEDWDDFKVISQVIKVEHHIEVARSFGVDLTSDEVLRVWGKGLRYELASYYGHPDPDEVTDEQHVAYLEAFNSLNHKYPKQLQKDTLAVHKELIASGIPLFMLTSHLTNNARQEMTTVGIDPQDYLFVHGSDATTALKPSPAAFDLALGILGEREIEPHEIIYGGDTLGDARSATGAGLQFLGVASGQVSVEQFSTEGFQAVKTIREFGDFVLARTVRVS